MQLALPKYWSRRSLPLRKHHWAFAGLTATHGWCSGAQQMCNLLGQLACTDWFVRMGFWDWSLAHTTNNWHHCHILVDMGTFPAQFVTTPPKPHSEQTGHDKPKKVDHSISCITGVSFWQNAMQACCSPTNQWASTSEQDLEPLRVLLPSHTCNDGAVHTASCTQTQHPASKHNILHPNSTKMVAHPC